MPASVSPTSFDVGDWTDFTQVHTSQCDQKEFYRFFSVLGRDSNRKLKWQSRMDNLVSGLLDMAEC